VDLNLFGEPSRPRRPETIEELLGHGEPQLTALLPRFQEFATLTDVLDLLEEGRLEATLSRIGCNAEEAAVLGGRVRQVEQQVAEELKEALGPSAADLNLYGTAGDE
jgi:hypothetical protein